MIDDLDGLPDDVRAEIEGPQRLRREQLDALGRKIAEMRDEAVADRKNSGIEETWLDCEEAYLGIDDENRNEFKSARWAKPMSMEGPLTRERSNSSDQVKATAFVGMTQRYVDAGTAKVCEIALPVDGRAFTLKATPVPEMAAAKDDPTPAQDIAGKPMPGPDGNPVSVAELAKVQIRKAEAAAEKAAMRVHDWMVEGKHAAEMRKIIHDMARIGVGVLKGPAPENRTATVVRKQTLPDGKTATSVERITKIKPAARWIDPWCFFPAPGCGEDIHNGDHCFELDRMLEFQLVALGKEEGQHYIAEAIDRVIDEGPGKCFVEDRMERTTATRRLKYDVWRFTGMVTLEDFEAANPGQVADLTPAERARGKVFVTATLVNDTVIQAILSPLDSNRLPYRTASWRRRAGHWAGKGVAEQIRTPQRIINAATRRMLDNAGKSSGAQVVMDPNAVEPANQDLQFTPDKLWWLKQGASVDDIRKVFQSFNWPNTTPQLLTIIEYAFKLAEENSNIPLVTQGQSGKTTPDTFGGQQLQDNNANQLLRDVGFCLNDAITTPLVDHYYEWLLLDPDVPDDEKGDYQVDTSGALALIEKAIQDQTIMAMGPLVSNPAFGLDPKKWCEAWLRSKRLVPAEFQYTEAQLEAMAKQPPPESDVVKAAKIRAEATVATAQSRDALANEKIKADIDRDTAHVVAQTERTQMERDAQLAELQIRREIALLGYANQQQISLDKVKADLAKSTMEMGLQRELAGKDGKGPQVAEPTVEPEGRAEEGEAFQA